MVADRPLPAALLPCSSNPLIPPHPHTARSLLRVRGMPARQRRRADPLGVCRGGAVAGCAARSLGCCRSVAVALFPDGQAWLFYSRPKPYKLLLPHCCYRLAACRRGRDPGQPLEHQRPQPGHRVRANDERPGCVCVWGGGWVRCVCGAVQWVCDAVPLLGDEDCCMCPSPVRCAAGARPLPMRTPPAYLLHRCRRAPRAPPPELHACHDPHRPDLGRHLHFGAQRHPCRGGTAHPQHPAAPQPRLGDCRVQCEPAALAGAGLQRDSDDRGRGAAPAQEAL